VRMKEHLRMAYEVYRQAIPKKVVKRILQEPSEEGSMDGSYSGTT
jgi:hypothetical protein